MVELNKNQSVKKVEHKPKATFFVAANGNNNWSGKVAKVNAEKTDGPFATLVRARDAVREMKAKHDLKESVTVMVRGGKYYLTETLVLSTLDSGTQDCPVTYTKSSIMITKAGMFK